MMLYQILPRSTYQFQVNEMLLFLKSLSGSTRKKPFLQRLTKPYDYAFIIDCDDNNKLSFYIECSTEDKEALKNVLAVFVKNDADLYEVDNLEKYQVVDTIYKENTDQKIALYQDDRIFLNILGMLLERTRIRFDFKISKASVAAGGLRMRGSGSDVELQGVIRVFGKTKYQRTIVKNISDRMCSLLAGEKQLRVDYRDSFKESILTGSEMMNIFQFPTIYRKNDKEVERIYHLLPGQTTLDIHEFSNGIYVGKLCHPKVEREVRVSWSQLRKHLIITGITGSGKSSGFEEMVGDLLLRKVKGEKNVPGLTLFDPAETAALGIIDKILKLKSDGYDIEELCKKVIYVDFDYEKYIFPISLLNKGVKETEFLDFFQSLYGDMKTINVDRMVTTAIRCLLLDTEDHTIFDVSKIFMDEQFREDLIMRLSGNMYASDEVTFLKGKFNQSQIDPILNRIDPFKNTNQKKLMFGMPSKYDVLKNIRKWMDEGYIVLFNIKSMGAFDRKVICGYCSVQYYLQALQRPDHSLLHFLVTDESHNLQLPIYPKIAAECRKPGLSLLLMTQMLQQYDTDFLRSLLDNINTIISFKQGGDASRTLSQTIRSGDVSRDALMVLPDLTGYVSTEDNKKEKSVLIQVKPPYRYTDGKLVDHNDPIAVSKNEEKNRAFARTLMARDCISKKKAEYILLHGSKDDFDEEKNLLINGDSKLSVEQLYEEGKNIEWD